MYEETSDWFMAEGLLVLEERMRDNAKHKWELEVQLYAQGSLAEKPELPEILRWPTS